jgi:hypothetical protein
MYLDMVGDWKLPSLMGVATTPLLAEDGIVLARDGYDPGTGLWCAKVPELILPEHPTRADAEAAAPDRLQELANSLTPRDLVTCGQKWLAHLTPFFTAREREHAGCQHRLFFSQVEFCDNLIFRSALRPKAEVRSTAALCQNETTAEDQTPKQSAVVPAAPPGAKRQSDVEVFWCSGPRQYPHPEIFTSLRFTGADIT